MLVAREFTIDDKNEIIDMVNEIRQVDNNFEGFTNIKDADNYEEFLRELETNKHQELIKPEYSPQTTYGVFDDERLIGGFNLRHVIKGDLINYGGNIGYLIIPSERGKGYGTKLLCLALEKAQILGIKNVLVSCGVDNVGSNRVIENNGGIYENNYYEESTGKTFKRFWIAVDGSLRKDINIKEMR